LFFVFCFECKKNVKEHEFFLAFPSVIAGLSWRNLLRINNPYIGLHRLAFHFFKCLLVEWQTTESRMLFFFICLFFVASCRAQ
jgi:hypothetical protein